MAHIAPEVDVGREPDGVGAKPRDHRTWPAADHVGVDPIEGLDRAVVTQPRIPEHVPPVILRPEAELAHAGRA